MSEGVCADELQLVNFSDGWRMFSPGRTNPIILKMFSLVCCMCSGFTSHYEMLPFSSCLFKTPSWKFQALDWIECNTDCHSFYAEKNRVLGRLYSKVFPGDVDRNLDGNWGVPGSWATAVQERISTVVQTLGFLALQSFLHAESFV